MSDRRSPDRRHTQPLDIMSDRSSQRYEYRDNLDRRSEASYAGVSQRERSLIERDKENMHGDYHDAEVVHVVREKGKRKADQRDEIIAQLSEKVREMSGLFGNLQSRLLDKEREVEVLRSDTSIRQTEHLEDEFREKERLMQQMITEKTESVELLKKQHESQIVAQGSLFNQEIDRRDYEIENLQKEVSRLQSEQENQNKHVDDLVDDAHHMRDSTMSLMDTICDIFEIIPVSSESELFDSLQRIKNYINNKEESEDINRETLTSISSIFDLRAVTSSDQLLKSLQNVKDYVIDDSFRRERLATVSLLDNICALLEIHPVKDENELLSSIKLLKNTTTTKMDMLRLYDSICNTLGLQPVNNEIDLLQALSRMERSTDARNVRLFDDITGILSIPAVHSESELLTSLQRYVSSPRRSGGFVDEKQLLINNICSIFELRPQMISSDSDLIAALERMRQLTSDNGGLVSKLIDSVTETLEIRPVRTESQLLESLRSYRNHDETGVVNDICDIFNIDKSKRIPEIITSLRLLKDQLSSNGQHDSIQELQSDKERLQDSLDALTKEFSEQSEMVGGMKSGYSDVLNILREHGHANNSTKPEQVCTIVTNICCELRGLNRKINRQLRHKQEIISTVLEDQMLNEMDWDSESSDDGGDLSDTTSMRNIKWGQARVRVQSIADRLCQREKEIERLYRKFQNQSIAASQQTPSDTEATSITAAPYLGLITETERAVDDTGPGVRLLEVLKFTAAERCGLHFGDRILSIGDRKLNCSYDLDLILSELSPGDTVDVMYLRKRTKKKTLLVVGPASDKKRKRRMNRAEIKARVNWNTK